MASKIDHFVVLMLENRSFDHMLGLLPDAKVNGLFAPGSNTVDPKYTNTVTVNGQPMAFASSQGAAYVTDPAEIDSKGFGGPGHSFPDATFQLYGVDPAPANLPVPAPMSGFAGHYQKQLKQDAHIANPTVAQIGVPMTAFTPAQLPVLSALAEEFCVCDQWFCEVPGPTQPNRLFAHAGTAQGFAHNVWSHKFDGLNTLYDELDKAGRDWGVYYFDLRDTDSFPLIKKRVDRIVPFDNFAGHAASGALPAYSFLCPRYNESKTPGDPQPNSQHAPYDVRNGENLIADVYEALRAGPAWPKTALIIIYDENGGYYDHEPPPTGAANPDGLTSPTATDVAAAQKSAKNSGYLTKPNYVFGFDRLGPRVPAVIVSPLIKKNTVFKGQLQHTSVFATLRDAFGIKTLTQRDAQAKSFNNVFSLATARTDTPAKLHRPSAAAPLVDTLSKPLTHQQVEMWPLLSQLDGHKDSGKVTAPAATRGQAANYIQQRVAAHNAFHQARRRKALYAIAAAPQGGFAWELLDDAGAPLARSPGTYPDVASAQAAIASLRDLAPFARQTDPG